MKIPDLIQTLIFSATIVGLIISIWNNRKQLKIFNKQLKLSFYSNYTNRYQEIVLNFPENINDKNFNYSKLNDKNKNDIMRNMRAYFNLCSEEYELWNSGYLELKTWHNWKNVIEFELSKKSFRIAWEIIKLDTPYNPEFIKWMDEKY